jgi:hypothetical protein
MKRHLILLLFFSFIMSFGILRAQVIYPIPSYHARVNKTAIFQQLLLPQGTSANKEKKKVVITPNLCSTDSTECICTVYVYSLDGQTKLGPFIVNCGESLTVEIDDRLWGVMIITDNPTCVDVYISDIGGVQPEHSFNSCDPEGCRDSSE